MSHFRKYLALCAVVLLLPTCRDNEPATPQREGVPPDSATTRPLPTDPKRKPEDVDRLPWVGSWAEESDFGSARLHLETQLEDLLARPISTTTTATCCPCHDGGWLPHTDFTEARIVFVDNLRSPH